MCKSTRFLHLLCLRFYHIMQNKSLVLNIVSLTLLTIAFLVSLIIGCILEHPYTIAGACLLIPSIAFTVVAMFEHRLFNIGALIFNCISYFITLCWESYIACFNWEDYFTTDYTCIAVLMSLSFYVFLPVSDILLMVFIIISPKEKISIGQKRTGGFDMCSSDLKELKSLLDCGIISQQEFELQKRNIFEKYDMSIDASAQSVPTYSTQAEAQPASHQDDVLSAEYKCANGINLILYKDTYSFVQSEGGKKLFGGTITYSSDLRTIKLNRTNAPAIELEICPNGLKLPNGGKYKRIK